MSGTASSTRNRLQSRERLTQYNTIDDAVNLIQNAKRIIILTGAGISTRTFGRSEEQLEMADTRTSGVSCGIPDFRSRNGIYALLQQRPEYDLDDPQQM